MHAGEDAAKVATALVVAAVGSYYWWKWSEANRRRYRGRSGCLPSPMPALPRWCGFLGGHALLLQSGKVRDPRSSHAVHAG